METLQVAIEEWGLYNNGILVCKWWDSETDYEDIVKYYQELKRKYNLECPEDVELFMADWENDELAICSEHSNIQEIFNTYDDLSSYEDYEIKAIKFLVDYQNYSVDEAINKKDDVIVYESNSYTQLAQELASEGLFGDIPTHLENYIDYEAMGNDLSLDYTEYDGKFYRAD